MTYDRESRLYLVGIIKGSYQYGASRKELRNIRKVEWRGTVSRDKLSTSTRNTLSAISTLFDVGEDAEKEILNSLAGQAPPAVITPQQEKAQLERVREDFVEKAREFIEDKIDTCLNVVGSISESKSAPFPT